MYPVFMGKGQKESHRPMKPEQNHMKLAFGIGTMVVADAALCVAQGPSRDMLHQFAEHLWSLLPAGGVGGDVSIAGQVQNGREQALKEVTIISHIIRQAKYRHGYETGV